MCPGTLKHRSLLLDRARGWGALSSLAQLHPGEYGYDQNKWNDSLLGLVVLFKRSDSKQGQFHIGFGDIPDHYSADANSNIEKNYPDYCLWYGEIVPYQKCPPLPAPPPPLGLLQPSPPPVSQPPGGVPVAANAPLPPASPEEQARLRDTVQAFLNAWYVQADYNHLRQFIAQDNFFRAQNPQSRWQSYFQAAFKPSTAKPASLSDAIAYHEMTVPKGLPKLQYLNVGSTRKPADPFAIIDPASTPPGAYFPPAGQPASASPHLSVRAQYFDHLRRTYSGRLYLVVYATRSPGLVPEGVVLYWILEGSDWKLAISQTTD